MTECVIPALARKINEAFPELERRAFAVSEVRISKENLPRLPACTVALRHETTRHGGRCDASQTVLHERLHVNFWLPPASYRDDEEPADEHAESVAYAFYDYAAVRDRLLSALHGWQSPQGAVLTYIRLDVFADKFAVVLRFMFDHVWSWCADEPPVGAAPSKIFFCLQPTTQRCE